MDVPEGYIRLSGDLEHDSIVNGPGLRAVLWTQGCRQRCPGCQNPETWTETEAGALVTIDKVKEELRKLKGQSGITFVVVSHSCRLRHCLRSSKFCQGTWLECLVVYWPHFPNSSPTKAGHDYDLSASLLLTFMMPIIQ